MHDAIGVRIADDYARLAEGHAFGMADLVGFAVRHAKYEGFERLAPEPFADGIHVHIGNYSRAKIVLPIQCKSLGGTPRSAFPTARRASKTNGRLEACPT